MNTPSILALLAKQPSISTSFRTIIDPMADAPEQPPLSEQEVDAMAEADAEKRLFKTHPNIHCD